VGSVRVALAATVAYPRHLLCQTRRTRPLLTCHSRRRLLGRFSAWLRRCIAAAGWHAPPLWSFELSVFGVLQAGRCPGGTHFQVLEFPALLESALEISALALSQEQRQRVIDALTAAVDIVTTAANRNETPPVGALTPHMAVLGDAVEHLGETVLVDFLEG
jgi:hypothetical protein